MNMVPLSNYLILSAILFAIGVIGFISRRNLIIVLMSIELIFNGANLAFIAFSKFLGDQSGHVFVFMTMTIAAAEAAVGLAIVVLIFRNKETVNVDEIKDLKG